MLTKGQAEKIREDSAIDDKTLSLVFSALSDPGRLRILKILMKHRDVCVSDVANVLNVSVPAASRHLSILESSGLVEKVRMGQSTCFRVLENNQTIKSVIKVLEKVENQ